MDVEASETLDIDSDAVQRMIDQRSLRNPRVKYIRPYMERKLKPIQRIFNENMDLPRTVTLIPILVNNTFLFATQPSEYSAERTADTIVRQYYATFEDNPDYAGQMRYLNDIKDDLKMALQGVFEGKQPLGSKREIFNLQDVEYSVPKRGAIGGRKTRRRRKRKARKRKTKKSS